MIVLDAIVLIAHLNPNDAHHDAATQILLSASPSSLLVHSITLAEVLVGGARIGRGAEMYADLMAAGVRLADHDEQEPVRLAQLRATSGLKLPDCCVLDTAINNDASLATFDHALVRAARTNGMAVLP
ncbi:type II toxin-antitoxin system VapC family toxin [Paenarthrobacter sp. Z7-10]|uniref:type II toxin-antitoxin system VapC family toxin n=1 Tax=Paenarthrobacter sp. Z7-10 TaxID=2787635 RepID=UPI0022A95320|nr:type II toxin-antitoxin system VapC family toxin [Paenarthrobacter sp. Z7-10]MCZ2404576.1 type II toxin-antitoxin system VapC family toxin [Paenarthrobacter sp. Z7-10]